VSLLRRLARYLPALALVVGTLALWQLVVTLGRVPAFLLPGPDTIWRTAVSEHDLILTNALPTLQIAVLGFGLALGGGVLLAVAIHLSRTLARALYPIIIAFQTVPVVALAPILVVLLGFTMLPKLIIVALICIFPIIVNTVDGLRSVDPDLINLMRTLGAGRWSRLRHVEFPSALPYLFSGAKVAVTFSVVGALFGEWVGSFQGLGYLMIQQKAQFDTAGLFATMAVLSLIGIGLFVTVAAAERLLLPWYHTRDRRAPLSGRGR
jgi:ABC-type nitrate/sulfonate/bicarbonate transport system permease component